MDISSKLTTSLVIPCREAMLEVFCPCIYFSGGVNKAISSELVEKDYSLTHVLCSAESQTSFVYRFFFFPFLKCHLASRPRVRFILSGYSSFLLSALPPNFRPAHPDSLRLPHWALKFIFHGHASRNPVLFCLTQK